MVSDQVEAAKSANHGRQEEGQRVRQRPLVRWSLPPPEFVKCNWDAAIDLAGKRMGVGIVIRNHVGEVVAAQCSTRPYIVDPMTAEAIAVWTVALFIRSLGVENVKLEGDSLRVVRGLQGDEKCWASVGHLLDDTKLTLGSCRSWQVVHVWREANSVTDKLAKTALQLIEEHQWRGSIPLCIRDIVMAENV
ncbi:uncharacterized protein LOC132181765 [Corylus avellana]|uniref:uncharacterized protein LOC132181765 n=1 Tax=Corylus avellana TaxID=13451 RepID=UPI00286D2DE1|nr:uncharacterized protein LOC132181765 [Corylus avellana]